MYRITCYFPEDEEAAAGVFGRRGRVDLASYVPR